MKSEKRYCPGPRISRLPWWPMGVRNATTAPSAVHTTNGVAGCPSDSANATAIGPSSTVVAESYRICVNNDAVANITSRIGSTGQSRTMTSNPFASSCAVPVCSIAMPSGITPAIITNTRTSISR